MRSVFWLAMVLHLGVTDHRLTLAFPNEHRGLWRWAGIASPLAGAAAWVLVTASLAVFHLVLALVAGATILSIFREEIPSARDVRVRAFLAGIAIFGVLVQARWWL